MNAFLSTGLHICGDHRADLGTVPPPDLAPSPDPTPDRGATGSVWGEIGQLHADLSRLVIPDTTSSI